MVDAIDPPLFVPVDDNFGIGVRFEVVPAFKQLLTQFDIVVDLAIKNKLQGTVFVGDGLCSAPNVNDAEPPMPQTNSSFDKKARAIRPAMAHCIVHGRQGLLIDRSAVCIVNAAYAAHK